MRSKAHIMLVEGIDDKHVLCHIVEQHGLQELADIRDQGGIDPLKEALPVFLKSSALQRLGVMLDADLDITARWASIRHILQTSGYEDVPTSPERAGTIISQPGKPLLGVWIMPDNSATGMLEDFVAFLVPAGDALWEIATRSVQSIPAELRHFPDQHVSKAEIHTWLAWQKEPGKPMGVAVKARYLDPTIPQARELADWYRRLFVEPVE